MKDIATRRCGNSRSVSQFEEKDIATRQYSLREACVLNVLTNFFFQLFFIQQHSSNNHGKLAVHIYETSTCNTNDCISWRTKHYSF